MEVSASEESSSASNSVPEDASRECGGAGTERLVAELFRETTMFSTSLVIGGPAVMLLFRFGGGGKEMLETAIDLDILGSCFRDVVGMVC